ncbi:hypothetical protein PP175_26965 (plasmid) [Aneurinibacillus sp. Ricciae_BoGa-3]|uniref:OmpL47-type beta-barrel domain-containing protein n=1 Tax=Aneurinibacillus sp. Ricciae_BoGa-3 TaxID=3022697 RepID=UPI002340797B|nr:hypothetical protein [Aneurinibacillus sp. Ricciae_BoGa-3]WCK57680.1 hypothetical protein PP175_26965 [Aneurinibacillus sp. Ricciae_BoGa-3]
MKLKNKTREHMRKNKILSLSVIAGLVLSSILFFPIKSFAYNATVPDIVQVTNKGNSAWVKWGVPMLPENTRQTINFDGAGSYSLYTGERNTIGNQSIVRESYDGSNALKVNDTWGPHGNADWWQAWNNYQYVRESRVYVPWGRFYDVHDGEYFSLTLKLRTQGNLNHIVFLGEGGLGRNSVSFDNNDPNSAYHAGQKIYLTQTAYVGSRYIYVDKPQLLEQFIHTPAIIFYSGNYAGQTFQIMSVNRNTGLVELNAGIPRTVYAWEELKTYTWHNGLAKDDSNINTNNNWVTYSMNMKVQDNNWNFKISEAGLLFFLQYEVPPGSIMWIDDIKYGLATKIRLYRNGTLLPMTNDQSYMSEFEDTSAKDYAAPNRPSNVQLTQTNGNYRLSWNSSSDNGSPYTYNITSVNKYGEESPLSASKVVTVISGLAKYRVYSGSTLIGETTNMQMDIPSSQSTNLSVVAVDNAGNQSTQAFVPNLTITPNTLNWTKDAMTLNVTASDVNGIHHIQTPDGNWVYANSLSYLVSANNAYTFVAVDNVGNQSTKSILVNNLDTIPPTPPILSSNGSWINVSSVPVTIIPGTDNQSGVNRTEYKLEGATNQGYVSYTQSFSIKNEGVTKITARTIDNVGNVSQETYGYVRIDRSSPINTSISIQKK